MIQCTSSWFLVSIPFWLPHLVFCSPCACLPSPGQAVSGSFPSSLSTASAVGIHLLHVVEREAEETRN